MATDSIAIADSAGNFLKDVDAQLPIYSLAKPFIASAVFAADFDISTPISHWIDESLVPRCADISAAQLLNHTSGLRDYGALPEYVEAVRSGQPAWSDDTFADYTLRQPLLFEPGEGWSYSNPGYWLLSQIVQQECGLSFDDAIRQLVCQPLGLTSISVAHHQFVDDLPEYPAEWVWPGVLKSNARDVVRFMHSSRTRALLSNLTAVSFEHPLWTAPHYGYGLMVEPGIRYGHNGGGPNYSASCFHFVETGLTGCVLMRAHDEDAAMKVLLEEIAEYA